MFDKILIANRGEIAVRIARTAKKMGIQTVAIYSKADEKAPHVRFCDEAVFVGPPAPADSYLRIDKVIEAAKKTGAEAIHPGYGFLSENAAFARAIDEAGLVFIGPTAETIEQMGSKSAAKERMIAANVPVTPGYQGDDQSVDRFRDEATKIGYPVLLKASAGGGGKGMRLVEQASDLDDALAAAKREAISAFGDDRFLMEKYIGIARHVEVQIFGDGKGDVVHLYERDCSIQRRHQKIIEEAPAPNLPAKVRNALLEAGVAAGKAVNYRGAGTVEFLYDGQDSFYFMEMNTRLQVEHPVSEAITGLDFVEWQLRIAAGEDLPLSQDDITERGHALEVRLYAEAPERNFAPSIGELSTLRMTSDHARVDSGVEEGQQITPFYDPMIAKIICEGTDRDDAIRKMTSTLSETFIAGLSTNTDFLTAICKAPAFRKGDISTRFLEDHADAIAPKDIDQNQVLAAFALWKLAQLRTNATDPFAQPVGTRLTTAPQFGFWLTHEGRPALLTVFAKDDYYEAVFEADASAASRRERREAIAPVSFDFGGSCDDAGRICLVLNDQQKTAFAALHLDGLRLWIDNQSFDIAFADPFESASDHAGGAGSLSAPMPGIVTLLKCAEGTSVAAGEPLLVMEAMKMEHTIAAPTNGKLIKHLFAPGDQVEEGAMLVEFEAAS